MANTTTSPQDDKQHDDKEVITSTSSEQATVENTEDSLINTEDIDPNPWGAVAITAILAVIILITWYSMFALNLVRS